AGLQQQDRDLILRGRPFQELSRSNLSSRLADVKGIHEIWGYLRPFSPVGSAGWLNGVDVKQLLARVRQCHPPTTLAEPPQDAAGFGESPCEGLSRTVAMLETGHCARTGLCVILSG